jgi:hypothetical protein
VCTQGERRYHTAQQRMTRGPRPSDRRGPEPVEQAQTDAQRPHAIALETEAGAVILGHAGGRPQGQNIEDVDERLQPLADDGQPVDANLGVQILHVGQAQRSIVGGVVDVGAWMVPVCARRFSKEPVTSFRKNRLYLNPELSE